MLSRVITLTLAVLCACAPCIAADNPSTAAERVPGLPDVLWAQPDEDSLSEQVRELKALYKEAEADAPKMGLGYKVKSFVAGGIQSQDVGALLSNPGLFDGRQVMVEGVLLPDQPDRLYPMEYITGTEEARHLALHLPPGLKPPTLDAEGLQAVGGIIPVVAIGQFAVPETGPPVLNVLDPVPGLTNQKGMPMRGLTLSGGPFAFRIGLLNDVNEQYADAIAAYEEFGKKYKRHRLASQAYYRAAVLSEEKQGDKRHARNLYTKQLWPNYVQLTAKTGRDYYVWRLDEEGGAYEAVPVKQAIGKHMDELNSERTLYQVMHLFVQVCGGRAWAGLLLLAVVTRLVLYPLTKKQMLSARKMQELQPELKALQEKYKDDRQALTRKMMQLYKERGVSPFGGCLPLLIQMPILIALYAGVRAYIYRFSLQGFLWVKDLSEPDLILLVAYTISMIVFQKMTARGTPATDPQQEQMQKTMSYMMPIMFFFFFRNLPAAFILYWLGTNIVYSTQQFFINRAGAGDKDQRVGRVITMPWASGTRTNPGPADEGPKDESEPEEDGAAEFEAAVQETAKKRRRRRRRRKPGATVAVRPQEAKDTSSEDD